MLTENTEYLDGFQYENQGSASSLQFFPTSEGYYDFQKKRYVYNYEDHVGNIRLAYYKGDNNVATIDKETNYYPFGLEYQGYNGTYTQTPNYTYGFQGQEKQKETGWSSFKWRNSIPELGRFFNVDPLSEKYAYQSHYNFSENRVVDGRELEGLEWIPLFRTGAVTPPPPNYGTRSGGSGFYEAAKSNATNNYNGIIRHLGNNINILTTLAGTGITMANRVLNSEGDSKADKKDSDTKSEEEGIIYKRKDKNGEEKDYVGQAKSEGRYQKRQKEHGKKNPDADYEFTEIDRGKPGKDLNQKEQKHIDEGGGPTNKSNPNGGLQNKRNQIKPKQEPKQEPKVKTDNG
jgi:RHS repeat-associated protein